MKPEFVDTPEKRAERALRLIVRRANLRPDSRHDANAVTRASSILMGKS